MVGPHGLVAVSDSARTLRWFYAHGTSLTMGYVVVDGAAASEESASLTPSIGYTWPT
jgi:hypothetical protein